MKKIMIFVFLFLLSSLNSRVFAEEPKISAMPQKDGKYDNHVFFVDPEKMDLEIIFKSIVKLHTHCLMKKIDQETAEEMEIEFEGIGLVIGNWILALNHVVNRCDCAVCEMPNATLPENISEKTYLVHNDELVLIKRLYKNPEENDIALFGAPDNVPLLSFPYPIGNSDELKVGNFLYQIGDRIGFYVVKEGIVSSTQGPPEKFIKKKWYNALDSFMITNGINAGDSGSPVIAIRDGNFELVGLVQGEFTNLKRMGWAIRINTICETLKKEGFDICR
jgi:S1-C subfamily serine protease